MTLFSVILHLSHLFKPQLCLTLFANGANIIQALSAVHKSVLGVIGPFGDGRGDGLINTRSDGLIIGVLEAERTSAIGGAIYTRRCVFVLRAFGKKDSKVLIEVLRWGLPLNMASMA